MQRPNSFFFLHFSARKFAEALQVLPLTLTAMALPFAIWLWSMCKQFTQEQGFFRKTAQTTTCSYVATS